jgi:hypothetical protein
VCLYSPASIPFAGAKFSGYEQGKICLHNLIFLGNGPLHNLAEGIILVEGCLTVIARRFLPKQSRGFQENASLRNARDDATK